MPYSDLAEAIEQLKYWATYASHVICVFSVFWALYLTHNLYIGLHIQIVILNYWALNVDHYSPMCSIIWAIYAGHFYYELLQQEKTCRLVFWATYMFHFIQVFPIIWAIYTVHFSWLFFFLIMGSICRP